MPAPSPHPNPALSVSVNGKLLTTRAATIAELLTEQGHADAKVATAVNGDFVAAAVRAKTQLKTGDRVEILSARQGG